MCDNHKDYLMNDESSYVRGVVAKHGNKKHAKYLLMDNTASVSKLAEERLEELGVK